MIQVIDSFSTNYSKNSLLSSANTYENYIVSKENCISRHDDKIGFLTKCRYHIILLGNVDELLKKLDTFCFSDQHLDCLYTLLKYRFSSKIAIKSGQLFHIMQRAVHFNQQNSRGDRMPSIAKKRLFRKNFKKLLFSSFQKEKPTQASR